MPSNRRYTYDLTLELEEISAVCTVYLDHNYICFSLFNSKQFMDLRTRYTALVTLMTQYVKFASETLKRTEDEEVRDSYLKLWLFTYTIAYAALAV